MFDEIFYFLGVLALTVNLYKISTKEFIGKFTFCGFIVRLGNVSLLLGY